VAKAITDNRRPILWGQPLQRRWRGFGQIESFKWPRRRHPRESAIQLRSARDQVTGFPAFAENEAQGRSIGFKKLGLDLDGNQPLRNRHVYLAG
jgi:hypothetical protein